MYQEDNGWSYDLDKPRKNDQTDHLISGRIWRFGPFISCLLRRIDNEGTVTFHVGIDRTRIGLTLSL